VLPERRGPAAIATTPWGTIGDLASAAFVLAALSGAAVAVPFDAHDAYGSVAALLLANPAGAFFRNTHYWAGQLCLVLTLAHVWDHLRARTEHRVARGAWLRLVMTLPLLGFIMLSGFLLRGDLDARQALRILTEATSRLPALGPLLATLLLGGGERLDVVYVQHAATATIAVWLIVIEHGGRGVWPRASAFVAVTVASAGMSLILSPGLHDGLNPVVKGPWYFLGLQEILHWTPWPLVVVLAGLALLAAFFALRLVPTSRAAWMKRAMLALLVAYAGLCAVGGFLRGENWAWGPVWPSGAGNLRAGLVFGPTPDAPDPLPAPLPAVMGRPEGCLLCHAGVTGLGPSHRPDAVGCASCHGGDVFTLDKVRAHAGMDLIPGNLAAARRTCGQAACHAPVIPRVERSLMATMSGIIEVDRRVFGEAATGVGAGPAHVDGLGKTAADTHLRQLCASCHLGRAKAGLGPNGEESRGGGCNACHLVYDSNALDELARYEARKTRGRAEAPRAHPALSLDIGNGQCFGCHSRSGRISTSYEGWHEMHEPDAGATAAGTPSPSRFRALADGRVFERVVPDVHQQRGLDCIDCHTAVEVMGDGTAHRRKSDQLRVTCEDCHGAPGRALPVVPSGTVDPESRRILALRTWAGPAASHHARTASGDALVNVVVDDRGTPALIRKRTGERRAMKPSAPVCVEGRGHARLSCGSCHTAWAPRCPTCHTSFDASAAAYDWVADADVTGGWQETSGPFTAGPPTLGVRLLPVAARGRSEVIDTFVPGMILTIDRGGLPGAPPGPVFRRLFARIEPHTTRREARSCVSCHNDPVALGYGRGTMQYEPIAAGGRWTFRPAAPLRPEDGLPADAWIPFLGGRTGMVSTRDDVRPFNVEEQRRILRVGACLTCHDAASAAMRDSVRDFASALARRSPRCRLPAWD
jgi:quinol-cytochrome oxidoreductase complex cytochrome b subunit